MNTDARPAEGAPARVAYWIATTFGLGDRVLAPGTFAGSLPAVVVWLVATRWIAGTALAWVTGAAVLAASIAGVWAGGVEARRRATEDPGPVVVDEVAGQWLACLVGLPWATLSGGRRTAAYALAAFVAFRFFDVLKPWPVRQLERLPGGWGIMADDLAAGLQAGVVLALAWHFLAR